MSPYSPKIPKPIPTNERRCEAHDFPMRKINGRWECVAEYLDRCVGQQSIVNVVQHGKTIYYVFENGHELPLLCSCCDGPLEVENPEETRQNLKGRKLEAMSITTDTLADGSEIEELMLEFSKWVSSEKKDVSMIPVSFNVASKMKHPATCPQRTRPAKRSSKKKRYRNIPGRN